MRKRSVAIVALLGAVSILLVSGAPRALAATTITGVVTDAVTGGPVEGVWVDLGGAADGAVLTGPDGTYRFEDVPDVEIYIRVNGQRGYEPSEHGPISLPGGGSVFDFALVPIARVTVSGVVTDSVSGVPVQGATVTITVSEDGGMEQLTDVTGVDGRYAVADVPESFVALDVMVEKAGYTTWDFSQILDDPYSPDFYGAELDIALDPILGIAGTVLDPNGDPLPGLAYVEVMGRDGTGFYGAPTNPDGSYFVEVDTGSGTEFWVSATPAVGYVQSTARWHHGGGLNAYAADLVDVTGGGAVGVDIVVDVPNLETITFAGTATNELNQAGVCVYYQELGSSRVLTPSRGPDGAFSFDIAVLVDPVFIFLWMSDCGTNSEFACFDDSGFYAFVAESGADYSELVLTLDDTNTADSCDARIGTEPARMDVSVDGFGDLLVGAEGEGRHGWNIGFGSLAVPVRSWTYPPHTGGQAGFGRAFTFGDFGPGLGFVPVYGAPELTVNGTSAGGVRFSQGGSSRIISQAGGVPGVPEDGDEFGSELAAGDFDGDGWLDLAVGVPGEGIGSASDAGAISIHPHLSLGAGTSFRQGNGLPGAAEADDRVGEVLVTGDLDGDGYDDLVVSSHLEDLGSMADAGSLGVLYGSTSGLTSTRRQAFTQKGSVSGAAEPDDRFAEALAIGDFDGDGFADVAVGVPGEDVGSRVDAGAVNVLYGSSSGLTAADNQLFSQAGPVRGAAEADDRFGQALATGDVNGDGYDDLVVGVPGEDVGSRVDAGAVNVIFGSSDGLTTTGNLILTQNGPLVGVSEAGDEFGYAVAVGYIGRNDGYADVIVGVPGEGVGSIEEAGVVNVVPGSAVGLDMSADFIVRNHPLVTLRHPVADERFGAVLHAG